MRLSPDNETQGTVQVMVVFTVGYFLSSDLLWATFASVMWMLTLVWAGKWKG